MRFVTFGDAGRLGLLEDDGVIDVAKAAEAAKLKLSFDSLSGLIEAGERGLEEIRRVVQRTRESGDPGLYRNVSSAQLRAPWPGQRLAMAGANSAKHVAECFTNMGMPMSEQQVFENSRKGPPACFWAVARPVMGPNANIEIPAHALGFFDYEGEAAFVLGKRGKDIKAKDAKSYIWGATLITDWSVREEVWPPKPATPLIQAKNFDCSKSIGPSISVGDVDPDDIRVETWVNGERRQNYSIRDMIFSFAEVLEYLSRDFTFYPGDVISMGTGAGTAIDTTKPDADGRWPKERFLKAGDTVEIRSPAIGSLVSHVVAKST